MSEVFSSLTGKNVSWKTKSRLKTLNTGLNLKIRVCLREKEAYKYEWNVIYFGAMFFGVQAQTFVPLIILQ